MMKNKKEKQLTIFFGFDNTLCTVVFVGLKKANVQHWFCQNTGGRKLLNNSNSLAHLLRLTETF